jgi:hypothetical protein
MENNLNNIENSRGRTAGHCVAIGGSCMTAVMICFCILLLTNGAKRAGAILRSSAGEHSAATTSLVAKQESLGDSGPFGFEGARAGPNASVPASPSNHRFPEPESLPNSTDQIVSGARSLAAVEPETAKVIRKNHRLSIRVRHRSFAPSRISLRRQSSWFQRMMFPHLPALFATFSRKSERSAATHHLIRNREKSHPGKSDELLAGIEHLQMDPQPGTPRTECAGIISAMPASTPATREKHNSFAL